MTIPNHSASTKKETPINIPTDQLPPTRADDCRVTKFEVVLISAIVVSLLLYMTHIIVTSYALKVPEICWLDKDAGLCRGYFESWYFNSSTGSCQSFIYGGCGGNANKFETKELCVKTCTSALLKQ